MLLAQITELHTAGVSIPLWGLPILVVALIAAKVYQNNRDKNR
ncbi:hypothetical protein [Actinotalea subterranea]|nr:hypothetical protein [Actinotalea subterranea]